MTRKTSVLNTIGICAWMELAKQYLLKKVLPPKSELDALHVAYATVCQMDALVSWNFQHLANVQRRAKVMAVNLEQGYSFPMQLVAPLEVLNEEK